MSRLLLLIIVIIQITIAIIAWIFSSYATNMTTYWGSVGWIEFLVTANWLVSTAFFRDRNYSDIGGIGGILPGISVVVAAWSIFSFVILCVWWTGVVPDKVNFALQIAALSITAVLCLIMVLVSKAVTADMGSVITKDQLLNSVQRNMRITAEHQEATHVALKIIRDYISYEMPHPARCQKQVLENVYNILESAADNPADADHISEQKFKDTLAMLRSA